MTLAPLPPRPPAPLRVTALVALRPAGIWLPADSEPCPCGERWGRCLLAEVREILRHPIIDLAIDSIMMAAVQ